MSYCPTCAQEFEAAASLCPDCEVDLVDDLHVQEVNQSALAVAVIATPDLETAETLKDFLVRAEIPVKIVSKPEEWDAVQVGGGGSPLPDGQVGLFVPNPMEKRVQGLIDLDPRFTRAPELVPASSDEEDSREFLLDLVTLRIESDEGPDPSVLESSPSALKEAGDEALIILLEHVRVGDLASRKTAMKCLTLAFDRNGAHALGMQLSVLAAEGRSEALFEVLREIRDYPLVVEVRLALTGVAADHDISSEGRVLALHALARLEKPDVYEHIVSLLQDDDPMIREEADETLCILSDEDMGFDGSLSAEERAKVMESWRSWFSARYD